MLVRNWTLLLKFLFVFSCALAFSSTTLVAQDDDGDGGDGDQVGGVLISADGLLSSRPVPKNAQQLNAQRFNAAKVALNKDLQQVSPLRKVSLNRLEAEVAKLIRAGKPLPADLQYLAGLTKITHVFCRRVLLQCGKLCRGYELRSRNVEAGRFGRGFASLRS